MKLALVVPAFPRLSESFIVTKALGLVEQGWDVRLVTWISSPDQWEAFGPGHPVSSLRDRVVLLPRVGSTARDHLRTARDTARATARHPGTAWRHGRARSALPPGAGWRGFTRGLMESPLVAWGPRLVHAEFGTLAPGLVDVTRALGCAFTASLRGYDMAYSGLEDPRFYATTWERVDAVHVLGQELWRRALGRGAPPGLPHTFIPPAVDVRRFTPRPTADAVRVEIGTPERPVRIVSVGRLHWKKGYDDALDAVARLRDRGTAVDYRIIGSGPHLEAVAFWRHQLGLDDDVHLLGPLPPDGVAAELARADLFLHAAVSEGFGNAPLEAQATGVPVVASDADGLAENVDHGVTGLVVPRRDPSALAEALARLIGDAELRQAMAAAGPERVRRLFDLPAHLDAWDRFYRGVLGEGPGGICG